MEVYFCKCCKYYTGDEWHFKGHLSSKKHGLKSSSGDDDDSDDDSDNEHIKKCNNVSKFKQKIHICLTCENIYMSKQSLQNHEAKNHSENDIKPVTNILDKIVKPNEPVKLVRKQRIPHILRIKVWNKWIGEEVGKTKCLCCKLIDISPLNFTCGHIVAESKGGELKEDNLKPICQSCNSSMGTENMNEFILKYGF